MWNLATNLFSTVEPLCMYVCTCMYTMYVCTQCLYVHNVCMYVCICTQCMYFYVCTCWCRHRLAEEVDGMESGALDKVPIYVYCTSLHGCRICTYMYAYAHVALGKINFIILYVTRHIALIECALACALHRVLACSCRVLWTWCDGALWRIARFTIMTLGCIVSLIRRTKFMNLHIIYVVLSWVFFTMVSRTL